CPSQPWSYPAFSVQKSENAPTTSIPSSTTTTTITTTTTTTTTVPALNAGTISSTPTGTGLLNATVFAFQVNTQPSGGVPPYSYSWNFGDGSTGSGTAPAHVYTNTGTFAATAIVADARGVIAQ